MITIYTRTTCAQCQTVKRFLILKGVEFKLINLDEKQNWPIAERLSKMGLRNVPVSTNEQESQFVTGFNARELTKLFNG